MSVADCRASRHKMLMRYGKGRRVRSVADAIAAERQAARRSVNIVKKKRTK